MPPFFRFLSRYFCFLSCLVEKRQDDELHRKRGTDNMFVSISLPPLIRLSPPFSRFEGFKVKAACLYEVWVSSGEKENLSQLQPPGCND